MRRIFYTFLIFFSAINLSDAQMIITGVYDGPLSGGTPKGVELYVTENIADLSVWGLGSANNGQGTDSVEYTFPAGSAMEGEYIYITNDSLMFIEFFGFDPMNETGAMSINGDDAIELFLNGNVVDIYGDINVDGNGEVWEYLDGWGTRNPGSGPDGTTFVPGNWSYSGIDQLLPGPTNDDCMSPYPLRAYTGAAPPADVDVEVSSNIFTPADITITVGDDVEWTNVNGFHNVNGSLAAYPSNPEGFISGAAAPAPWTFRHTFTVPGVYDYHCDPHQGLGMVGTVTVVEEMGPEYVPSTIAEITNEDADGVATSVGNLVEIAGIVHTVNFRPNGLQFVVIDGSNNGINIFNNTGDLGYTVNQGDLVTIQGTVGQFRGLTQINPDNIVLDASGQGLNTPRLLDAILGEDTESKYIHVTNLQYDSTANGNLHMHNADGVYLVRVDSDTEIDMASLEQTNMEYDVTGVGGQFASSTSSPFTDGYQLLPSVNGDIVSRLINSTNNVDLSADIKIYPSLTAGALNYESKINVDKIVIRNSSGKSAIEIDKVRSQNIIDVTSLSAGFHTITFVVDGKQWTTRFVKQ